MKDLISTRIQAHIVFIETRIAESKRKDFLKRAFSLLSALEDGDVEDRNLLDWTTSGEKLASEVVYDIVKNTRDHAECHGRDFYLEKI